MELSELKPQEVKFKVCGLDLTYRPFTIGDDLKAQELCGGQKKMSKAFEEFDFEKITLVAWYQLTLSSQKLISQAVQGFVADKETGEIFIDPLTGEEKSVNLTPIDKFRNLFVGVESQMSIVINLIKCKGLNIPNLDDEEGLKKWNDQLKKVIPSTGQ